MRETITNDSASDWPKFVKRLQDLGVIKIVYTLIQSTALQDLSHPLLEFQALTKVLLRKWRDIPVDLGNSDHRRAMKSIQLASNPQTVATDVENGDDKGKKKNSLEKWRRLGFECDRPEWEFEETGYLGMMDLTDYVKNDEDGFHKLLLEQSSKPAEKRCPIARASIAVTAILYEHFEVEKADVDDAKVHLAFESRSNFDKVHTPMILKWPIVHTAGLQAFLRLWQTTGAELEDFMRIVELVRILLEAVVGGATRTTDIHEVETSIAEFELQRLRKLQMEYLEVTYEDTWGHHLRQTRDGLKHEALQFIKEQRIRCLLAGAWFPNFIHKPDPGVVTKQDLRYSNPDSYRYVKLSRNRKWLRYADFDSRGNDEPALEDLHESVDLNAILTVTSDITSTSDASSSTSTLKVQNPTPYTKITINGLPPFESRSTTPNPHARPGSLPSRNTDAFPRRDVVLLTLHPQTPSLASEWLDGLLMLLGQKPITAETNKLITMIKDYGLKIRLLNVDLTNMHLADDVPEIPSREGLDDNYYYDVIEG